MALVNDNFLKLPVSYLFSDIAMRVNKFKIEHPDEKLIRLGIGDVTRPIAPVAIEAMHAAVDDMSNKATFHGYGPEQGYDFLIETIIKHDYTSRGVELAKDEVFVSDGAKSDTGNIGDILSAMNTVAVTDPVYPVYVDSNVMGGRGGDLHDGRWSRMVYLPTVAENGFVPEIPKKRVDLVYLCYPNNPTGTTLTKEQLKMWVDYAIENNSLILFDAAYEAFIQEDKIPHSIYEIEGAKQVAIEFRSFSKTAGFTGVRCGYTVVPKALKAKTSEGKTVELNPLWNRRQCTKFNGTSYITQRGAQATYSEIGRMQVKETIDYYMNNAKVMKMGLDKCGFEVFGGMNAPYIWLKTPEDYNSWQFFDFLLNEIKVVGTPGVGFGPSGEGYLRLSAFGDAEETVEAMYRLQQKI